MEAHYLKILPQHFKKVKEGIKTFELRKNDRNYKVGDKLVLKEWYPGDLDYASGIYEAQHYTGREVEKEITYILEGGQYGLEKGYVILGII